ncbi:terminase small subunit protein [Mesorhizobium retamae]|uniref:Terminase small subunit protein n=1 Tax=Mesorhizobium retamae TaxID=2912854 RepID=A0ABS9QRA0_9HYPH|nr:terminase small subunit protein [Mesorhizobium sp. IRAMC:0171]MCG7509353.1 terminase small subunit protein [Mesorhizobium sp. IRAMC:0171]
MGRPTKYSQKMADLICDQITEGRSLRSICRDEDMPNTATVFRWLARHEDFAKLYAHARDAQADALVDEMIDIADDGSNDWMEQRGRDGEVTGWKENGESLKRSALRLSTRQWIAEKLKPKKYGNKVALTDGEGGPLTVNVIQRAAHPSSE